MWLNRRWTKSICHMLALKEITCSLTNCLQSLQQSITRSFFLFFPLSLHPLLLPFSQSPLHFTLSGGLQVIRNGTDPSHPPITSLKHELGIKSHIRKFAVIILRCYQHRSITRAAQCWNAWRSPGRKPASRLTDSFGN